MFTDYQVTINLRLKGDALLINQDFIAQSIEEQLEPEEFIDSYDIKVIGKVESYEHLPS